MTPQQKLKLMMSRQSKFRWGDIYVPATMAAKGEGPKNSRLCQLNSRKLDRTLQLLSIPERLFAQLALYNENLVDIHEQKILSPVPTVHPLFGHVETTGIDLPSIRGTLQIAQAIEMKHHKIVSEDDLGVRKWMPFPYQGDLLLYMRASDGHLYAVNWTVKDSAQAFGERNCGRVKSPRKQKQDEVHARNRARLEELYYLDARIRTVRLSLDLLDKNLIANLILLYGVHERVLDLDEILLSDFSEELLGAVERENPVAEVAIRYSLRWGRRDQFLTRSYQDIWYGRLPVCLFFPVLIDHPLQINGPHVLDVYGDWFREFEP